jgi:hypothetical protein
MSRRGPHRLIYDGGDAWQTDGTASPGSFEYAFKNFCDRLGGAQFWALYVSCLAGYHIGTKVAGLLAEPLGKLLALQKLNLGSAVCSVLHGLDGVVLFGGAMHDIGLCI